MAKDIMQVIRGQKKDLPQLLPGQIGFCTDTEEVFIGNGDGNANVPLGAKGERGADGVTYIPNVTTDGVLSWTNDGDEANPAAVNLKGDKGDSGAKGNDGVTFTPHMSENGILTWTNDGGHPNPPACDFSSIFVSRKEIFGQMAECRKIKFILPNRFPEISDSTDGDYLPIGEFTPQIYVDGQKAENLQCDTSLDYFPAEGAYIGLAYNIAQKEYHQFYTIEAIEAKCKNGVVTIPLYHIYDIRLNFQIGETDKYIYEGANKDFTSENSDSSGETYTIEFDSMRTLNDLTTNKKTNIIDAINELVTVTGGDT